MSGWEAFCWTQAGGMVGLGDLGGNHPFSIASAVSADGSVVVGGTTSSALGYEAFRWTQADGMVGLGWDWASAGSGSSANAVSGDGSVVVGGAGSGAFRWTQADGMVGLGGTFGPGGTGVSADGSVVVGDQLSASADLEAFIWDQANGIRLLQSVLTTDYGLDLTGWRLSSAGAISADGLTIVGWGRNPSGNDEAWRATLGSPEPVPVPGAALLGVLGLSMAGWRLTRLRGFAGSNRRGGVEKGLFR